MANDFDNYASDLERALNRLQPQIDSGRIVGDGHGQFLVVEKGQRGIEIYWGENGTVVVDPAVENELRGEIEFRSYEHALDAATRWLNGADWEALHEHAL